MKKVDLIILAGGFATRLGKMTEKTPKILLTFQNQSFLKLQLDSIHQHYNKIIFALGHMADLVIEEIRRLDHLGKLDFTIDPSVFSSRLRRYVRWKISSFKALADSMTR